MDFCSRFTRPFRQGTRTVETAAQLYVRGLPKRKPRNMERMEEVIPEADHQALQHLLSESAVGAGGIGTRWPKRPTDCWGHADSALLIDESGCPKKGTHRWGWRGSGAGLLGKVENGQVGVFAARSGGTDVTLIDERLFCRRGGQVDEAFVARLPDSRHPAQLPAQNRLGPKR
ncbi:MAG: transposase [Candidatus Competibacteraceae bacterium]|nr:transposase [Candidatus Competibacteraceae bacterium]